MSNANCKKKKNNNNTRAMTARCKFVECVVQSFQKRQYVESFAHLDNYIKTNNN